MKVKSVIAFLLAFFLGMVLGCHTAPPPYKANGQVVSPTVAPVVHHLIATSHPFVASVVQSVPAAIRAITSTPPDLKPVAHWLDVFIVIGVLVAGGGIGVYFAETALRKLAYILLAVGGSIGVLSILVRTTLWLDPWISAGFLLAGVTLIAYEVYRNRTLINSDVTGALTLTTSTVPVVRPPFPQLGAKVTPEKTS